MKNKKAVSLLELSIVIVILGILVTLGFVYSYRSKEDVFDKEAIRNLKLIRAAEASFRIEVGSFYPSSGSVSNIPTINQNLGLVLNGNANRGWDYLVKSTGCSQADRNGGSSHWYLEISDPDLEPNSGVCP